jgi:hypothetical protein
LREKIKYYLEGSTRGHDRGRVDKLLADVVKELEVEWFEADKYQLGRPYD